MHRNQADSWNKAGKVELVHTCIADPDLAELLRSGEHTRGFTKSESPFFSAIVHFKTEVVTETHWHGIFSFVSRVFIPISLVSRCAMPECCSICKTTNLRHTLSGSFHYQRLASGPSLGRFECLYKSSRARYI